MSYLLYCIFRSPAEPWFGDVPGVKGKPVFVATQNGLSAALSELPEPDRVPDISQALAYEKVVEQFYRDRTVIPARYGCRVEEESEARCLLEKYHHKYETLLHELEGMGEMGIHVLLDGAGAGMEADASRVPSKSFPLPGNSGTAYLRAKRQHYLGLDQAALPQRLLVDELCDSLAGLFIRRKVESAKPERSRLLSFYFLVPRRSVEPFCHAVRHFRTKQPAKLLLSGPWPPYNFVDPLEA